MEKLAARPVSVTPMELGSRLRRAGLVAAAALAVRLAYLGFGPAPVKQPLVLDAADYHARAVTLARTGRLEGPGGDRSRRMPGYPLFLAGIYTLFGPSPLAAGVVQAVVGALTCALIYLAASGTMSAGIALAAGLFAAVYYDMLTACGFLLSETLGLFFLSLALWLLSPPLSNRRALAAGLALGATCLIRAEFGLLVLLAMGLAVLDRPIRLARPALIAAGAAACLAPWAARNYVVLGRLVPATTSSSESLYIGLYGTLRENLGYREPPATPPAGVTEPERMDFFARATKDFYRRAPRSAVAKALVYNLATLFYPFLPEYDATFVFIFPFFLAAFWPRRDEPWARFLGASSLGLIVVYLLAGQTVSRYRQMLSPFLILLGFMGLERARERLKRLDAWIGAWAGANITLWVAAPFARSLALGLKARLFHKG